MHRDTEGLALIQADIEREADALEHGTRSIRDAVPDVRSSLPESFSRAYLIGCGDSLDAGIASRFAWESLDTMPVEAVPAMTFATSIVERAPRGSLVVALSQSGKVSRVVEAVRAARSHGLTTVTITANAGSPLASEPADATWVIDFEKLGAIPGTTSHLLGTVALYELGCELTRDGRARDRLRSELDDLGHLVGSAIEGCRPRAIEHAEAMDRDRPFLSIGYGPVLSSARFTVRKLLELTQLIALSQETEEYAHDEYSLVDPSFRVMQFAPPDRGKRRNLEIAHYLNRLGVHLSVVTDGPEADAYRDIADVMYGLPEMPASLAPLVYAIPGQVLSLAAARRVGGSLYGMAERVHRADGDPQIYESEIAS